MDDIDKKKDLQDCLRVKNAMSDILTDFGESQSPGKIDKTVTD